MSCLPKGIMCQHGKLLDDGDRCYKCEPLTDEEKLEIEIEAAWQERRRLLEKSKRIVQKADDAIKRSNRILMN
jgi:hypothetical protein